MSNLNIKTNYSLLNLNTLHLESVAKYFIELTKVDDLEELFTYIEEIKLPYFILGGGSNLILPNQYNGVVIANRIGGMVPIRQDDNHVYVKANSGEEWDAFVAYTLEQGWYGLENLSLIPGVVGASPIQNIGAYGVEVKDFIDKVIAYDVNKKAMVEFTNSQCHFTYRHSYFKDNPHLLIVSVIFKLNKIPKLNTTYAELAKQIATTKTPTPQDLRKIVISIRSSKLPNPKDIGNVGSFFHNPILDNEQLTTLKYNYPNLPSYHFDDNRSKVSAGWLIDNLGLKGYSVGSLAVYEKQALVIVNRGISTQKDVLEFAKHIQDKVWAEYQIKLNIEPIIVF